jgi:hypothetical protein
MNDEPTLIVMRLTNMYKVHPRQDESKVCSKCDERVGIYPSGQAALKANPDIKIVCINCANIIIEKDNIPIMWQPAASVQDLSQEIKESVKKE